MDLERLVVLELAEFAGVAVRRDHQMTGRVGELVQEDEGPLTTVHDQGILVVPGLGARCVDDNPWVTGAETCELALALDVLGEQERAVAMLASVQHLREDDGAYWTGYVYADDVRWPVEQSSWTAAAVILAVDALSNTTGGAGLFRGDGLPQVRDAVGEHCGCRGPGTSADRVAGLPAHSLQNTQ